MFVCGHDGCTTSGVPGPSRLMPERHNMYCYYILDEHAASGYRSRQRNTASTDMTSTNMADTMQMGGAHARDHHL
jgi:hypothetical protein